jgi:hypothetical protein
LRCDVASCEGGGRPTRPLILSQLLGDATRQTFDARKFWSFHAIHHQINPHTAPLDPLAYTVSAPALEAETANEHTQSVDPAKSSRSVHPPARELVAAFDPEAEHPPHPNRLRINRRLVVGTDCPRRLSAVARRLPSRWRHSRPSRRLRPSMSGQPTSRSQLALRPASRPSQPHTSPSRTYDGSSRTLAMTRQERIATVSRVFSS